jgi:predicted nuclease with RNAse H fold
VREVRRPDGSHRLLLHLPGLRDEHRLLVEPSFFGIDVGAERLHVAGLGVDGRVGPSRIFARDQMRELLDMVAGARVVAVDAPAQITTLPHLDDPELSAKFRQARCAEVALGRDYGIWVPFVAPAARPNAGWMETGFSVFDVLADTVSAVIETFPYAGFRALSSAPLAKKTTVAGATQRVRLLRDAGVSGEHMEMWSHDSIDALLAALVAAQHAEGCAIGVGCGHDESVIWLPAPPSENPWTAANRVLGASVTARPAARTGRTPAQRSRARR